MANEIVITYEVLFDLLRREKNREELQELVPDFYEQVLAYLEEKQKMVTHDSEVFGNEKAKIQIANIKKIVKELYERRERKIINLALYKSRVKSNLIDTRALLHQEKDFFNDLTLLLNQTRETMLDTVLLMKKIEAHTPHSTAEEATAREQPTSSDEEKQDETKLIRFTHAVPKFLGTAMEIYGPFEEEDIANLPSKIAQVLIEKGRAEEIAK
ncbi:hypothetical protein C4573_02240 [Candidatus Woesearchaeota archaeon]|nr:MAG: hypothetical protein C4573_02240 [Candidatus Woesearchaeota archaeon]